MGCDSSKSDLLRQKSAGKRTCRGKVFSGFVASHADIYDGDTLKIIHYTNFDSGPAEKSSCRIIGIDTAEIRNPQTRSLALASRDYLCSIIPCNTILTLTGYGEDKYGRLLVEIKLPDGSKVSTLMLQKGGARYYDGKTKRDFLTN